jgi:hypothetical protein
MDMQRILLVLTGTTLLFGSQAVFGQEPKPTTAKERARAAVTDHDVTYGRIKEITADSKVVINVDNAPDKTFDMKDKNLNVTLGKGLKVGDAVKVQEKEVLGKTKAVTITKHTGSVKHGDKDPAARKP